MGMEVWLRLLAPCWVGAVAGRDDRGWPVAGGRRLSLSASSSVASGSGCSGCSGCIGTIEQGRAGKSDVVRSSATNIIVADLSRP